jgi:ribosomal protein S18 acetylase RimI-like enzyme
MEYFIVRVEKSNYLRFDNMVFHRINERERTEFENKNVLINEMVYKTLEDKNLYIFAAQIKDKFIGWVSSVYIPKIGKTNGLGHLFIDELWVNPDYRNNGIAYKLMEKASEISKELNALGLRLYVNSENNEAFSLYKKLGYVNKGMAFFMEKY